MGGWEWQEEGRAAAVSVSFLQVPCSLHLSCGVYTYV